MEIKLIRDIKYMKVVKISKDILKKNQNFEIIMFARFIHSFFAIGDLY